jgi:spermidine synthase
VHRVEDAVHRVEIWDQGRRRSLWFDDLVMQSEIDLDDPGVLPNALNGAMLAPLMFGPPRRVLLAGCGGGAIARWLHARAPEVAGDAVECSAEIADLARDFFDFPSAGSHWRLVVRDVRDHLADAGALYDYILVDIAQEQVSPAWVTGRAFLTACRDRLARPGYLVLNLLYDTDERLVSELVGIRSVFGAEIGLLADPAYENLLVIAAADGLPPTPSASRLQERGARWGLDLAGMSRLIRRLPPPTGR